MLTITLNQIRKNIPKIVSRVPAMFFVEIILTYKCTQRCMQCNIPDRASLPGSTISIDNFKKLIDKLHNYGTQGIVLSGGEPCSHPDFFELLNYTIQKKFTYIHILSNLFIPKLKAIKLAEIISNHNIGITTSFDGLGAMADKIRGGKSIEKITLQNMKIINEAGLKLGKSIKGSANIVLSQLNLSQAPEIINLLTDLDWKINIDLYRNSSINHNQIDEMQITDLTQLQNILNYAIESKNVVTPSWLLEGFLPYLKNEHKKQCPYINTPSLGSKFFIQPNGDLKVCIGDSIGNIFIDEPKDIFSSKKWQEKISEFENCRGCWNTCYTPASRLSNYLSFKELANIIQVLKN